MLMIKTFKVLFFIIVIITCIILGLWQIDRANEKAYLYHAFNERISKNPIQFEVIKSNPVDFTKIIITGTYISNKQFLLDNKSLDALLRQQSQRVKYVQYYLQKMESHQTVLRIADSLHKDLTLTR